MPTSLLGRATPYALFFFSGISGLVYQVVWVRQFGNLFGNTVHSASLVTAVFMCGLGLGSYLAGVWADRQASKPTGLLLAAYGWSEIAIGLLGAALAVALPRLAALSPVISTYTLDEHGWHTLSAGSLALRYALSAALLAPITLLMGGTLTVLIRHVLHGDLAASGSRIGALYGLNTAGAALGCLLTDFALVPSLGLLRAQLLSAAINVSVGLLALSLARSSKATPRASSLDDGAPSPDGPRHVVALTALALALTGFAGMGLEILWLRFLSGALGQYRTVFSLLLAIILVGIWAGSVLGGALHRRLGHAAALFFVTEALFVTAALGLMATFDREAIDQHVVETFRQLGSPEAGLSPARQLVSMARTMALLVGLPSLLMGATFPLANANVQRVEASVGRRAGSLYLANTVGSVIGSLLTGFVLIPRLGVQGTTLALGSAAAASIVPLYLTTRESLTEERPLTADDRLFFGSLVVAVLSLAGFFVALPEGHLLRKSLPDPLHDRFVTISEGPSEVLAVGVDGQGSRRLWTNGHSMSTTSPEAQRYMRAFVHVPLLLQEAPRDVLVICFGVGNTAHAATLHPTIEHVDVADLSAHVLEHARHFVPSNRGVLTDRRTRVFVNDGRQHLRMAAPGSYDLVTLEPPPISFAGVSALYSRELYELAKSRLRPGGHMTQWLPIEQLAAPETLSLVRAFIEVFPGAVMLSGERRDLILLGARDGAVQFDAPALARHLEARPEVLRDLERIDLAAPAELVGTFVASAETLLRATKGARPVTDDDPRIEYSVTSKYTVADIPPQLFDVSGVASFCPGCAAGPSAIPGLSAHLAVLGRLYASKSFLRFRNIGLWPVQISLVQLLEHDDGAMAEAVLSSGYLQRMVGIDPRGQASSLPPTQLRNLEAYVAAHPDSALAATRLGEVRLSQQRFEEAAALFAKAGGARLAAARMGLGIAQAAQGKGVEAEAALREGLAISPRDARARERLAEQLLVRGQAEEGRAELAKVLADEPHAPRALTLRCLDLASGPDRAAARDACQRALDEHAEVPARALSLVGVEAPRR